ncbi:MAG: MoaD/ThiS family protein [Chloroflexi bacterium]|nr:MAG: MoaD/ThiS family protein [Chloroflexota bacterium]
MKVNFYATLRPIAGQKTVEFDLPANITVRELLTAIVTRFPPMDKELLDEDGELYRHVHVFINGRDAPYLSNAVDTPIKAGDKVDVFPAVGGG